MSTDRIAVIGSGPAGLMCAWAARQAGYQVQIFTNQDSPTTQTGAQYLHGAIPGLTDSFTKSQINYWRRGNAGEYARKIYGPDFPPDDTSWGKFGYEEDCWNLREVYWRLWQEFLPDMDLTNIGMDEVQRIAKFSKLVFSTMPLNKLVDPENRFPQMFESQLVYCYPVAMVHPETGNIVVYDGTTMFSWYRSSVIFGSEWTEWPSSSQPLGDHHNAIEHDVVRVGAKYDSMKLWQALKPIRHHWNLSLLLPPNVLMAGRYGMWQKGVLTHDAYTRADEAIKVWQDA